MSEIKCLDRGYAALVETMGDDRTPAKCARTSYRNANQDRTVEQDAKLTKYLVEHQHTTPLEFCQARFYIKCPMFVGEQILRHRTACLTGDMRVSFDAPKSKKQRPFHYPLTVAEIYKKWSHPSRRARVQSMQLRQVDETTGSLRYSRVVDIWSNGVKAVYKLTLGTGETLRCTLNHRLLTDQGWLIAEDAIKRRAHVMVVGKQRSKEQVLPVLTDDDLANDRIVNGNSQRLSTYFSPITNAEPDGQEEVFDLEVEGPFHNFVANGCVVHNSINKVSFRYVEAQPEFYVPELDRMNPKHASNKQGSNREVTVKDPGGLQREFKWAYDNAFESYQALLRSGLAPEIARCVLPAGVYTEFYIQNDLHNWLKFLSLRLDEHAQWETKVYAQAILDLLQPVFPTIIQAWKGNQ